MSCWGDSSRDDWILISDQEGKHKPDYTFLAKRFDRDNLTRLMLFDKPMVFR